MVDNQQTERVYFTILPSSAGFTDQLLQFNTFYKLGLSLGFCYLHSDFVSNRPGSENIYEYLGFNDQFTAVRLTENGAMYRRMGINNRVGTNLKSLRRRIKRKLDYWVYSTFYFREFNFIDIGLGDEGGLKVEGDPLEGLGDRILEAVKHYSSGNRRRKNVVRFNLTSGEYFFRVLAPLLNQRQPYFTDGLDLRAAYLKNRELEPGDSQYVSGKLQMLVHIRLGDTAIVETPWHTFIPLWDWSNVYQLKEYPDKNDPVFQKLMDVEDFARFLEKFFGLFDAERFSVVVSSDGYQTAFRELFKRLGSLKLGKEKVSRLKQSSASYESDKFAIFNQFTHCDYFVGETNENLEQLVHHAIAADLVVVGCHQRMIPKLLSTYYSQSTRPTVIIALHNGIEPLYADEIGINEQKARVCPVNINKLDSDEELNKVVEAVGSLCESTDTQ